MKKVLIYILILISCIKADCQESNSIYFNNEKYVLLYSEKTPEHAGYLNEYFKHGEYQNNWSEIINVIHFPNAYSPIDHAQDFSRYLNSIHCPNACEINEDKNSAILDFILIDGQKLPIILEFNVFKYEKYPECGTIAIQYVKRYSVYSTKQVDKIKKEFKKFRPKTLKKIQTVEIPAIVKQNINEIKLNDLQ